MDASLEAFVKYRLERIRSIAVELDPLAPNNLIPSLIDQIKIFLLQRPPNKFFAKAKGTRFIREDLIYLFPAVFGFDLRGYITGEHIEFKRQKLDQELERWEQVKDGIRLLSRLRLFMHTYNLLNMDVEQRFGRNKSLKPYLDQVLESREIFNEILPLYLKTSLNPPAKTKSIEFEGGKVATQTLDKLGEKYLQHQLEILQKGSGNLSIKDVENLFFEIGKQKKLPQGSQTIMIDPKNAIEANLAKMLDNPIDDAKFQAIIKVRYDHSAYLCFAALTERNESRTKNRKNRLQDVLKTQKVKLKEKTVERLGDFIQGEAKFDQYSFYFKPLSKMDLDWSKLERRSVYLGTDSGDLTRSPEDVPLPQELTRLDKRPVVMLLDISWSMIDRIDFALKSVELLFNQLKKRPLSVVLFSSFAGILNDGVPLVNDGTRLNKQIEWLYPVVEMTQEYGGLGEFTSIGNGILSGKAVAMGIARQMKNYQKWLKQNKVVSHCVIVSDNLHNTPRDVAPKNKDDEFNLEHKENVVLSAAKAGCSIHNIICSGFVDRSTKLKEKKSFADSDDLVERLQNLKYKSVVVETMGLQNKDGSGPMKAWIKKVKLYDRTSRGSVRRFKVENKEDAEETFELFTLELDVKYSTEQILTIAGFVMYLKDKMKTDLQLRDAFQYLCKSVKLDPGEFYEGKVNLGQLVPFYNWLLKRETFTLENFQFDHCDGDPLSIFEMSQCITQTQHRFFPFSTTPVVLSLKEPVNDRQSFCSTKYFGMNNLKQIQSVVDQILEQIKEME